MTDRHQAQSYPLRMPPALKERVAASAKESGRSLHAEIVHRLEASFAGPSADGDFELRVAQQKNQERLQMARDQLSQTRMLGGLLRMRLEEAVRTNQASDRVEAIHVALLHAQGRVLQIEATLAQLLGESRALDQKYSESVRPTILQVSAVVRAELQAEWEAARRLEASLIAEMHALNPTEQERDALHAQEAERIAQQTMAMYRSIAGMAPNTAQD